MNYVLWIHTPGTIPSMMEGDYFYIDTNKTKSKSLSFQVEGRINLKPPYGTCTDTFPAEMQQCIPELARGKFKYRYEWYRRV